jgi:hypothetical protein
MDPKVRKQRLDAVPMPIRVKMGLEENLDAIRAIKNKFRVPADSPIVAQLLLRLMIEDLPPQYFAWEIKSALSVSPETAKQIAAEIRIKVLEPLRDEFKKISIDISLVGNLEEPPARPMATAVPRPKEGGPMVLDVQPVPVPAVPKPTITPAVKAAPVPSGSPPALQKPAPFIMHQESAASPLATGTGFKLNVPSNIFKSPEANRVSIPRPPKTAELEIGKSLAVPKPAAASAFRTEPTAAPRVVHYTDLRTSVAPGFGAQQVNPAPIAKAPVAPPVPKPAPSVKPPPAPKIPPVPAVALPPKPPKVVNFGPGDAAA